MWFVLSWAFRRRPGDENTALKQMAAQAHQERQLQQEIETMSQAVGQTWEQMIFAQGEALGLKKGEEAGIKKGEQAGIKKGEQAGIKKGEEAGIKKGELIALRSCIQDCLEQRFGEAPRDLMAHLDSIENPDELRTWMRRALQAASLQDLSH
jgi:hypothetical protein